MPVLGADPTVSTPARREHEPRERKVNEVFSLANYLLHHPGAHVMRFPPQREHAMIAFNVISRLRKRGYTYAQVRKAIDVFFSQHSEFKKNPVYTFATNDVLHRVLQSEAPAIDGPIMQYLTSGCSAVPAGVPWHEDDIDDIRRAVLVSGQDLVYRYPDVVADIVGEFYDDVSELREQITLVSKIVQWNLDEFDESTIKTVIDRVLVRLPKELRTPSKSPGSIRPAHDSVADAVAYLSERHAA